MTTELQQLADWLARRVGRSLIVEDRQHRLLAYTQHSGPLDDVRQDAILARHTGPEVMTYLARFGLHDLEEPLRLEGCDALGMMPRVCVPIRHQESLQGFLWFIDTEPAMLEEDVAAARAAGGDFAFAMYRANLEEELAAHRETDAVRDLLVGEPSARVHAAQVLIGQGALSQERGIVALVCAPILLAEHRCDDLLRVTMEHALVETRRRIGPRQALHHRLDEHGLLIVEEPRPTLDTAEQHAEELHRLLASAIAPMDGVTGVAVGVGQRCARLEDVRHSYGQAREAAEVAQRLESVGPIARWERLGVYRTLVRLGGTSINSTTVHPGLAALLGSPDNDELVATLETYLDLAGNAQAAAARLYIHRGTLYHRLHRIEEIAGTDLRDGGERLALHLGLKLARLRGSQPAVV